MQKQARYITLFVRGAYRRFSDRFALSRLVFTSIVPLAVSYMTMRYLVVPPGLARDPLSRFFGRLGHQYPVFFAVGCTIVFMAIANYLWSERAFRLARHRQAIPAADRPHGDQRIASLIVVMAVAVVSAMALRSQLAETHLVLSSSMLPSLAVGDQVAINKTAYRGSWLRGIRESGERVLPRHGELIVFEPTNIPGVSGRLLKRVMGLPGDRIRMQGAAPIINDWIVPRCDVGTYANVSEGRGVIGRLVVEFLGEGWHLALYAATPPSKFEEYNVRDGELFVLGDNRAESIDSRAWVPSQSATTASTQVQSPTVAIAAITGRADWFLVGTKRDGAADFSRALQSPSHQLRVEGVDLTKLEDGIRRCVAKPPASTHPPKPTQRTAVLSTL